MNFLCPVWWPAPHFENHCCEAASFEGCYFDNNNIKVSSTHTVMIQSSRRNAVGGGGGGSSTHRRSADVPPQLLLLPSVNYSAAEEVERFSPLLLQDQRARSQKGRGLTALCSPDWQSWHSQVEEGEGGGVSIIYDLWTATGTTEDRGV